jgi:hypothetical protein
MSNLITTKRLIEGSMSKTDLLLRCQYWASGMITLPKTKAAYPLRFGTAFHKTMEIHLKSGGKKKPDIPALAKEYEVEAPRLKNYYERGKAFVDQFIPKNFPGKVTIYIEEKLAYDPFADAMRFLVSDKERDYSDIKPNEFPGTGDLVIVPEDVDYFGVLDWKTGSTNYDPQEKGVLYNGQLASISLAMSRYLKRYKALVWIVRIDDEFMEDYPDKLDADQLEGHRKKLARAIGGARSANPVMYPGQHCHEQYCPAVAVCPSVAGPMALRDDLSAMEPEQKAHLYARYMTVKKMLDWMDDFWKEEIRRNGPFQLENGKWATLQPQSRENLSKASIMRALGPEEGAAVVEQLRDSGCIETSEFEKIAYLNDPSGRK